MCDEDSNIYYLKGKKPARQLDTQIGRNIRRIRLSRNLELSELCVILGVSEGHLSDIESGKANVFASEMFQFADALEMPVSELYLFDEVPVEEQISEMRKEIAVPHELQNECVELVQNIDNPDVLLGLKNMLLRMPNM